VPLAREFRHSSVGTSDPVLLEPKRTGRSGGYLPQPLQAGIEQQALWFFAQSAHCLAHALSLQQAVLPVIALQHLFWPLTMLQQAGLHWAPQQVLPVGAVAPIVARVTRRAKPNKDLIIAFSNCQ